MKCACRNKSVVGLIVICNKLWGFYIPKYAYPVRNKPLRMFSMRVITGPLAGGGAVYHVILPSWLTIAFLLMTL